MPWSQSWRPGGSSNIYHLGLGSCPGSSRVCPCCGISRPILSSLLMGEHGPGGQTLCGPALVPLVT